MMIEHLTKPLLGAMVCSLMISANAMSTHAPAYAQSSASSEDRSDCMIRTNEDGTQVSILVPYENQAAMRAEGFEATPCKDSLGDRVAQMKWRDEICTIAATSSEAIQEALSSMIGARPAVLCGMAEQVIGSWDQQTAS